LSKKVLLPWLERKGLAGKLWGYTTRDFAFIILALNGKISLLHFAQSQISSSLEAARDVKSTGLCT